MSKYRLSKILQTEINKLNEVIDLKIIRGLSYTKESRRHKFLMKQLEGLHRQEAFRAVAPRVSWFQRSLSTFGLV